MKFSGEKFAEFEAVVFSIHVSTQERANALKTRHDQAQSHQRRGSIAVMIFLLFIFIFYLAFCLTWY